MLHKISGTSCQLTQNLGLIPRKGTELFVGHSFRRGRNRAFTFATNDKQPLPFPHHCEITDLLSVFQGWQ